MNKSKKFKSTVAKMLSLVMIFSLSFSNLTFADETQEIILWNFENGEDDLSKWSMDNDLHDKFYIIIF